MIPNRQADHDFRWGISMGTKLQPPTTPLSPKIGNSRSFIHTGTGFLYIFPDYRLLGETRPSSSLSSHSSMTHRQRPLMVGGSETMRPQLPRQRSHDHCHDHMIILIIIIITGRCSRRCTETSWVLVSEPPGRGLH